VVGQDQRGDVFGAEAVDGEGVVDWRQREVEG
jgi:hypothetical protein